MPYISKAEQDRHNWPGLHDTIHYVALCDGCSADDATRQIIRAIADGKLRARWGRSQPADPASFFRSVTVYLGDAEACVDVDDEPRCKHCAIPDPKVEIVSNAFKDDDFSKPILSTLWLAREDIESIWRATSPLILKTPSASQQKPTQAKIKERLRELLAECREKGQPMPNVNETWDVLYTEGIRSRRKVLNILSEDEFKSQRRRPGQRKRPVNLPENDEPCRIRSEKSGQ